MVETDVHFPTDTNLLWDAIRKTILLTADLASTYDVPGWRQAADNLTKIKSTFLKLTRLKHSTSKNETRRQKRADEIKALCQEYLDLCQVYITRAEHTTHTVHGINPDDPRLSEITAFIAHARRQVDQTCRRVLKGESIPYDEKVFSIFQPHTQWISKGKAGVPQELGLRVSIIEDQHGFILGHMVMEKDQTDEKVAVEIVRNATNTYGAIDTCSFDKGFYRPGNREELEAFVRLVVLPKKGRLNQADKEREYSDEFMHFRRKHSAVESGINALEVHGLDRCPDHGIDGFKRYVALAVTARNIQKLGRLILDQQREALKKAG